jgi:phosphatidylglycerophosphate synthase
MTGGFSFPLAVESQWLTGNPVPSLDVAERPLDDSACHVLYRFWLDSDQMYLVAFWLFVIAAGTDSIDRWWARRFNPVTRFWQDYSIRSATRF